MAEQSERKILWLNWNTLLQDEAVLSTDEGDTRTATYCRDDEQSLESYIGYVRVCSVLRKRMKSFESAGRRGRRIVGPDYMFDLGFLPITMVPSYWDPRKADTILQAVKDQRLIAYPRASLGLSDYTFYSKNMANSSEWWVSKLDISERTGKPLGEIGLKEVFNLCGLSRL